MSDEQEMTRSQKLLSYVVITRRLIVLARFVPSV